MTYDALGRLLTRRIVSPVVADPVLTDNIYDEAVAGYYNIGRLTTSANAARTQKFNYSAHGLVKYRIETDSAGSHHSYVNLYFDGSVHYKSYWIGTGAAFQTEVALRFRSGRSLLEKRAGVSKGPLDLPTGLCPATPLPLAFRLAAPNRASPFHCHGRRWSR
jgi:YD repeat-containing protein